MEQDNDSSRSSVASIDNRCATRFAFYFALLGLVCLAAVASAGIVYADDGHDRDGRRSRQARGPAELVVDVKARVERDRRDGREFEWRITVKNEGDTAAGPFWVHYLVNQASTQEAVYPQYVASLGAGKKVTFTVDLGPCVSANYIYVYLDPYREVPEANELNNERYFSSDVCLERERRGWWWD